MANAKGGRTFWNELISRGLYKRNQGLLARQATFAALMVMALIASFRLEASGKITDNAAWNAAVCVALAVFGIWIAFRLVNYPKFADFLISVQAEMDKVTWASRGELYRATVVVLSVMFLMAALLWIYDFIWAFVFKLIGFLDLG